MGASGGELSFWDFRFGISAHEVPLRNVRLRFALGKLASELSHVDCRLRTFVLELSFRTMRLITSAWKLGTSGWELGLDNFHLRTFV